MLVYVFISLIYSSNVWKWDWNVLQIRVLVMFSLFLQVVLIISGNRRKYTADKWLQSIIWFAYLSADRIAIVALGILSRINKIPEIDPNFIIIAIWAPFLLVHLGGPDTITAYSLEDNELWPRHMLELVYQLALAVYVVYRSWTGNALNYVTIPILVAGIVKYGERIWSLWCGSSKRFRESILPSPDPGPNYAKFMDDYTAKKHEGYQVTLHEVNKTTTTVLDHQNSQEETGIPNPNTPDEVNETTPTVSGHHNSQEETGIPNPNTPDEVNETTPTVSGHHNSQGETGILNPNIPDARALRDGFKFNNIPECLFADLIISFQDHKSSQVFFQRMDWKHAFQVIAVELGLMYDKLYTKAAVTNSKHVTIFLKSVSFFCTFSAFITFSYLIHKGDVSPHHLHIKGPKPENDDLNIKGYNNIIYDQIITLVLFGGAIVLEIYAVIVLLSSSRVMLWFNNHNNRRVNNFYRLSHTVTWSNLMSQFNLVRFCLKDEPVKCMKIQKLFHIYNFFEKSYYKKTRGVPPELKELIFSQLVKMSVKAIDIAACKKLCAHNGDRVLMKKNCHNVPDINWSIEDVEFDQSILLWHIATDLCYSLDDEPQILNPVALQFREKSILLSDYMLYLLVICPFLLPNGIGQIRFEDTCAELDELLKERKYIKERSQVCNMILRVNTEDISPSEVKGDRSKSVLFDACRLAKSLQSLDTRENWSKRKKWKMISHVWVEMLCHAASQCRGLNHAKQLSQGGELLTHVWLLMAHLGITEQFQISKGHVRAKLKLS